MKWGTVLRNSIDVYSCGPRTMFAGTRTTSAIYPSIVTARWVSVPLISTRRTALHVAPVRRVYRVSVLQQRNPVDHCHTVLSFIHSLPVSLSPFFSSFSLFVSLCLSGYCFQGYCPTLTLQCEAIWGYGGFAADRQCYEQFNSKGSINGHCGRDANEHYIKCEPE